MDPADSADVVHHELARLPLPRAPHSLLPRVLAAVDEWSSRPWYTRAWFAWPLAWQALSLAALALLVAGFGLLIPSAQAAVSGPLSRLSTVTGEIVSTAHYVDTLIDAGRVLWRVVIEPLAVYAIALMMLMGLTCAAFGGMLNRLAVGRPNFEV
jgi:hypothetical protein